MSFISQLEPANKADFAVYQPYYPKDKHTGLPFAISLYNRGYLEGKRQIEGGGGIPFAASWHVSKLPSELTRCRIQFDGQGELSYEITLLNSEFIDYLIELIKISKRTDTVDFPQRFYRKLLQVQIVDDPNENE